MPVCVCLDGGGGLIQAGGGLIQAGGGFHSGRCLSPGTGVSHPQGPAALLLVVDFDLYGKCVMSLNGRVAMETCARDFASAQRTALEQYSVSGGKQSLDTVQQAMCRFVP